MKKKFLSLMFAAALLVTAVPTTAYADDPQDPVVTPAPEYEEYSDGDTADMDVTIHIDSEFAVRIPKRIEAYEDSIDYTVGVKGSILKTDKVFVIPESTVDFELKIDDVVEDTVEATVNQTKQSWASAEINPDTWTETEGNISANEKLGAGEWTSVLKFNVRIGDEAELPVIAVDGSGNNLNATATEITGTTKDNLLADLVSEGHINDVSEVVMLLDVTTDDFTGTATAKFDVSDVAEEGDTITIYHYDESAEEWEFITNAVVNAEGKISANFTSFSPVAFVIEADNEEAGGEEDEECEHSYEYEDTTPATCTTPGVRTYTCDLCGDSYTEDIEKVAHTFEDNTCSVCGTCETHSYDEGVETKAASCTETGIRTFTCDVCENSYTEEIEMIPHSYDEGICNVCGASEEESEQE